MNYMSIKITCSENNIGGHVTIDFFDKLDDAQENARLFLSEDFCLVGRDDVKIIEEHIKNKYIYSVPALEAEEFYNYSEVVVMNGSTVHIENI